MRYSACYATRHSTGISLPVPLYTYQQTYSCECVHVFVRDSVIKEDTELLFALVFGEFWPGEILGQVKLLLASQLRQKAHWILSHHSLLKQIDGVFLVCVNLGWNVVFLLFSMLNIAWQIGNINSRAAGLFTVPLGTLTTSRRRICVVLMRSSSSRHLVMLPV